MGIRFLCPNGHRLNVKEFLAGKRAICPHCGQRFYVPLQSMPTFRVAPAKHQPEAATGHHSPQLQFSNTPSGNGAVLVQDEPPSAQDLASTESVESVAAKAEAPSPDVFTESPSAVWYIRRQSGEQSGPTRADVIRRWFTEGRIPADALVWREDWPQWRRADSVFPYESPHLIGSEFDFDPDWLRPAGQLDQSTAEIAAEISSSRTNWCAEEKQRSNQRQRIFVSLLIVAVIALVPAVIYVLTR